MVTPQKLTTFKKTIWAYYKINRRDMPWREKPTSYYVVVSEIMLQQTQVDRVIRKFETFIKKFPDWKSLAQATNTEVLREWSGLGYNRRALSLKKIAEIITEYGTRTGKLPTTADELQNLPGVGPNTAGSILAFAFNAPHPFIETNIRSVFIHFFFKNSRSKIHDDKLIPLIEKVLQDKYIKQNAREWYYALMDYGSYLKKQVSNPSRKSLHHVTQKPFKGSNRELRSRILKLVLHEKMTLEAITKNLHDVRFPEMIAQNLNDLEKEGFLLKTKTGYSILDI